MRPIDLFGTNGACTKKKNNLRYCLTYASLGRFGQLSAKQLLCRNNSFCGYALQFEDCNTETIMIQGLIGLNWY